MLGRSPLVLPWPGVWAINGPRMKDTWYIMKDSCAIVMTTWGLIRPPIYFQGNLRTPPNQDWGNLCRKWRRKEGRSAKEIWCWCDGPQLVSESAGAAPVRAKQGGADSYGSLLHPSLPPSPHSSSINLPPSFPPSLSNPCPSPRRHRPLPPEVGGEGGGGGGGGEGNVALHKKLVVVKVLEDTVCVLVCVYEVNQLKYV